MRDPRSGSAREAVCRVLSQKKVSMTVQAIAAVLDGEHGYGAVQQAVQTAARHGELVREGQSKPFRYGLRPGAPVMPTTSVADATPAREMPDNLSPAIGTVCGAGAKRVPENRANGTIEEALRAVISAGLSMTLDEIFLALPIGWSRREASSALQEGTLDGWLQFDGKGWSVVGDPPEKTVDATRIFAPATHAHQQLVEIRSGLDHLLGDAVRLRAQPPLIRSLANAYAEVDSALGQLHA